MMPTPRTCQIKTDSPPTLSYKKTAKTKQKTKLIIKADYSGRLWFLLRERSEGALIGTGVVHSLIPPLSCYAVACWDLEALLHTD